MLLAISIPSSSRRLLRAAAIFTPLLDAVLRFFQRHFDIFAAARAASAYR